MRKAIPAVILLFILAGIASTSPALAQGLVSKQKRQFQPFLTRGETTWSINAGLRNNKTGFATASDATGTATPNIQFEQTFDDVSFIEIKGKVRHVEPADIAFIKGGLHAEAELTGGLIVDGFSQLSQYLGDNRTLEALRRSTNQLNGDTIGGAVALGYQIHLTGTPGYKAKRILASKTPRTTRGRQRKREALRRALNDSGPYFSITPLIGYGVDQQGYRIEEGFELIPTFQNTRFDAEYITNWYGLFYGLESEIKNKSHMLRLRGQYHDLDYDAELKDNVAGDSFENEADGEGYTLSAEYSYALADDYAFTLEGFYQKRETDPGTSIQTIAGATRTVRLDEVDDESNGFRLGFRYNWD